MRNEVYAFARAAAPGHRHRAQAGDGLDASGNAISGVRAPELDVPVATYTESTPDGTSLNCSMSGRVIAFGRGRQQDMYPNTLDYLVPFVGNAIKAAPQGLLIPDDAVSAVEQAIGRQIP